MLVVTRRKGESVMVGDDIEIRVLNTPPGRVTLGFTAPDSVRIRRVPSGPAAILSGDVPTTRTEARGDEPQSAEDHDE